MNTNLISGTLVLLLFIACSQEDGSKTENPDESSGHYPFFRTSTTQAYVTNHYVNAAYIAFSERGKNELNLMAVPGAGFRHCCQKNEIDDYAQHWDRRVMFDVCRIT